MQCAALFGRVCRWLRCCACEAFLTNQHHTFQPGLPRSCRATERLLRACNDTQQRVSLTHHQIPNTHHPSVHNTPHAPASGWEVARLAEETRTLASTRTNLPRGGGWKCEEGGTLLRSCPVVFASACWNTSTCFAQHTPVLKSQPSSSLNSEPSSLNSELSSSVNSEPSSFVKLSTFFRFYFALSQEMRDAKVHGPNPKLLSIGTTTVAINNAWARGRRCRLVE